MTMVLTSLGSSPAAAMLCAMSPALGPPACPPPVPESISNRRPAVLTARTVNGNGMNASVRPAAGPPVCDDAEVVAGHGTHAANLSSPNATLCVRAETELPGDFRHLPRHHASDTDPGLLVSRGAVSARPPLFLVCVNFVT